MNPKSSSPTLHSLNASTTPSGEFAMKIVLGLFVLSIIAGSLTGYGISTATSANNSPSTIAGATKTDKAVGVKDTKRFPDKAEGMLKEGGLDGEGSFHLERPGGESQNVYLTSSIVDLSEFLNKKIRVWGQTFSGQKAGWLMDVGYVEAL